MMTLSVSGGPSFQVPYTTGMNGQNALEFAYSASTPGEFTYSLQYYGGSLGYLVDMINETYDTFISRYAPYYYWQFLVNGTPSTTGIDQTVLQDGDVVVFEYTTYNAETHAKTPLHAKHEVKAQAS